MYNKPDRREKPEAQFFIGQGLVTKGRTNTKMKCCNCFSKNSNETFNVINLFGIKLGFLVMRLVRLCEEQPVPIFRESNLLAA